MKKFSTLSAALLFSVVTCLAQSFTPDPSFGLGGKVYTNVVDINKSDEVANAIAIQADGKIVIAGSTIAPAIIIRRNTDGSADNSFGQGGTISLFAYVIKAIVIQPDGKILAAGKTNNDLAVLRLNTDGSLDNSFDGDGRVIMPIGPGADIGTAITLQADGKIVVAGYSTNGSNNDFTVVRLNNNGTPDNSFDADGKVITPVGGYDDDAVALAIQADGKIVVGGHSFNGTKNDFALVRYNTDGSPDNSFDSDGKLTTSISTGAVTSTSLRIQSDQKIILGGYVLDNSSWEDFVLCRYNTDGSPDNSFDGDGKVTTDITHTDELNGIQIQADGKILIAGRSGSQSAMLRYTVSGGLDNSFDGDGIMTSQVGYNYNRSTCLAIQADGKIVTAGKTENQNGTWEDIAIARYNMDGTFDNSFDGDGQVTLDIFSSDDHARCMAVQSDGKIVVAGYSFTTVTNDDIRNRRFTLARYNTDGTLDNSFGVGGRVLTAFGGSENYSNAIAIQSDGKIVLAGTNLAQDYDFALVRYNTDGTLDNSFDGDGKVTTSLSTRQDGVGALVIQSDGKIIAGGFSRNSNNTNSNFAVARFNADGSLDNSFDGDGKFTLAVGPGTSVITSMAVQNDGKILLAGSSHNGNDNDFTLVRLNTDGSIDNSFDGDGIATTDMGGVHNYPNAMAIQNDGKIVLAGHRQAGTIHDFALVRYNTNGNADNTFDGDGIVITDAIGGSGILSAVIIQNNGQILVGGYSSNGSNTDFALVRYNSNGGLDNTFDGDGKALYDLEGGSNEVLYAMQLRGNRIYLAGDITTAARSDFALVAILNDILTSPLPLQLRDFSGKRVNNDALLTWKTENETNMLEYTVERSVDGRNYSAVGTVSAANRAGVHYYNLTDHNITSLNASVIYYRLKQKGIDGKFAHSRIIALPLDKNKNIVLFYPNPVINEANVALTVNGQDKLQVRIIDNKGRIMKQQQWNVTAGSTSLSIDVTNLAKGMYYLEIKGESIDYKKQFVK